MTFIDINTYIIDGTSFKTFLKKYASALLESCYLLKKMLNVELNMMF